ncbi:hypothetical protein CYMTET_54378 [Cymbomonas tetramitiformis]|uniref:Uncharacterized protein n=1 Tax=Cymbomonas tetramitiformis TaxID=36881 RepID=A0AAE0BGH1_9CHLO|nr:hypothetical protein CYMTET_54378 [Cymbomonas tetramitiformis]
MAELQLLMGQMGLESSDTETAEEFVLDSDEVVIEEQKEVSTIVAEVLQTEPEELMSSAEEETEDQRDSGESDPELIVPSLKRAREMAQQLELFTQENVKQLGVQSAETVSWLSWQLTKMLVSDGARQTKVDNFFSPAAAGEPSAAGSEGSPRDSDWEGEGVSDLEEDLQDSLVSVVPETQDSVPQWPAGAPHQGDGARLMEEETEDLVDFDEEDADHME